MARKLQRSVAVVVSDLTAQNRVVVATRSVGYSPVVRGQPNEDHRFGWKTPEVLLVYDLSPGDPTAEQHLRSFHRRSPDLPVLLYVPPRPGLDTLAGSVATIPGVTIAFQFSSLGEVNRLQELVRKALAKGTAGHLTQIVRVILGGVSSHVIDLVEEILVDLSTSVGGRRVTVGRVAERLAIGKRTLEHACRSCALPVPRDLLDWLILLYSSWSAERAGGSTARAARLAGIDGHRLYRIRHRLLPPTLPTTFDDPRAEFTAVVHALATACDVQHDRVRKALHRLP